MSTVRRFATIFSAVAVSLGLALGIVATDIAPASAATNLAITQVRADSPGVDRGSNASKNAEYVVIKNTSKKSIKLTGYSIRDASKHVYLFPKGFVLKAGKSVSLHTGSGKNTAANLYWGQRGYVWNNTGGDVAKLQKGSKTLSTFAYTRVNPGNGFAIRK